MAAGRLKLLTKGTIVVGFLGLTLTIILGVVYGILASANSGKIAKTIILVIMLGTVMLTLLSMGCMITSAARKKTVVISRTSSTVILQDSWYQDPSTIERFFGELARDRPIRFSPQQLAIFTLNFTQQLGSGGFGVVYKGEFPNGVQIAVKVLNRNLDERAQEQFMAEVGTIGRVHHINLVRLYGFCFDPTMKALVYEFMANGSLDKLLFSKNRIVVWEKLFEIAIGVAKGIAYLHEECQHQIIHYDIKPGNILLDVNFCPKVADFGLAKLFSRDESHITISGARGTPGYAAPELWLPFTVTSKCDVYSFGMLLFEVVGRRRNLDVDMDVGQDWFPRYVWEKLEKEEMEEVMEMCGVEQKDREKAARGYMVALWCVQYKPELRPAMSGVVKMLEGGVEIPRPTNPFRDERSTVGLGNITMTTVSNYSHYRDPGRFSSDSEISSTTAFLDHEQASHR